MLQCALRSCAMFVLLAGTVASLQADASADSLKLARQLQAKLQKPASIPGFKPNTPVQEVLGYFSEKHGLTILIDIEAFQSELQIQEPVQQPIKMPPIKEVRLSTILDLIGDQCQGKFVQQGNLLWLVPKSRAWQMTLEQPVDLSCDEKPLEQVLRELSERTGTNVVLDRQRAGKAAETPITLHLSGETLEAAVILAADLAELEAVRVGHTLYVTTPANAHAMKKKAPNKRTIPAPPIRFGL